MKVAFKTKIGIWSVVVLAYVSPNPYRHDEGEDNYSIENLSVRTQKNAKSVLELLTDAQREQVVSQLIEQYHEDKIEEAEYRDQCRIEDLRLTYA